MLTTRKVFLLRLRVLWKGQNVSREPLKRESRDGEKK